MLDGFLYRMIFWKDEPKDVSLFPVDTISADSFKKRIQKFLQGLRKIEQGILVDSGAGASVANGDDFPEFVREPSQGSQKGQHFCGPGKERIPNRGQKAITIATQDGTRSKIVMQDADVRRPILAVNDSLKVGNLVLFDQDISAIVDRNTPEGRAIIAACKKASRKVTLEQKNGVFIMPSWVIAPNNDGNNGKLSCQRQAQP